jgi:hypothetical protein
MSEYTLRLSMCVSPPARSGDVSSSPLSSAFYTLLAFVLFKYHESFCVLFVVPQNLFELSDPLFWNLWSTLFFRQLSSDPEIFPGHRVSLSLCSFSSDDLSFHEFQVLANHRDFPGFFLSFKALIWWFDHRPHHKDCSRMFLSSGVVTCWIELLIPFLSYSCNIT